MLVKRAKLLAHDWASGCLARAHGNGEVVTKKMSVTMASRFEIVDEEFIKNLKKRVKINTTRKACSRKNVFKKWVNERNFRANL